MEAPVTSRFSVMKRRPIGEPKERAEESFDKMQDESMVPIEQEDSQENHAYSERRSSIESADDEDDDVQLESSNLPCEEPGARRSITPSPPHKHFTKPCLPLPQKDRPGRTIVKESQSESSDSQWILAVACAVIIVLLAFVAYRSSNRSSASPSQIAIQHCDKFFTLRPKYPTVDPIIWNTLNVSVNRAVFRNPGEPATFIFLYNSDAKQNSLLEEIIDITSTCFGGRQPIRLQSSSFETAEIAKDYHAFINAYQAQLEARGILVVRDLDRVPPSAAQAFFTICDSYEPLVNKAVIFFTMDISKRLVLATDDDQTPTAIAEQVLKSLWRKELSDYMLNPLVVRLTENVFKI